MLSHLKHPTLINLPVIRLSQKPKLITTLGNKEPIFYLYLPASGGSGVSGDSGVGGGCTPNPCLDGEVCVSTANVPQCQCPAGLVNSTLGCIGKQKLCALSKSSNTGPETLEWWFVFVKGEIEADIIRPHVVVNKTLMAMVCQTSPKSA